MTLRDLRTERKLTLKEVGAATGIWYGHLSQIERGVISPTPSQIAALSEFFKVDLSGWRFVPIHEGEAA